MSGRTGFGRRHLFGRLLSALGLSLALCAGAIPLGSARATASTQDNLVIVIAASTGITNLSSVVLRATFSGLQAEHAGIRLIPFNAPVNTPIRRRLDSAVLGLEPAEVGRFWINQRVRDGRRPPRTIPNTALTLRVVAQIAGALACVPQSAVSGRVTALRIDGRAPGDRGYILAPE